MIEQNNISFWVKSLAAIESPLLSLAGAQSLPPHPTFDIAIVGGGLTGLWLAYYLQQAEPDLSIAIFEKEQVGFGASGRNGGWLSREVPIEVKPLLKRAGITETDIAALYDAMEEAVSEVIRVTETEGIECDIAMGGVLTIATNPAQQARLSADELRKSESLLSKAAVRSRINIPSAIAGHYDAVGARIHPLKLLLGLKQLLLARGIKIYEHRKVSSISSGALMVWEGIDEIEVYASKIVSCTEAYSQPLLRNRKVIPVNSSIIVTEVIGAARWEKIGWEQCELLADDAHLFFYAQRTFDDRILIGGRGSPYQFGGKDAGNGTLDPKTQAQLLARLHALFPWEDFRIEYAWRGSIGVTRDWCATVTYDALSGLGQIFGFVGSGVTTTNLAARTMADRLLGRRSTFTKLPWNDHDSPCWEPEPLRWIAIQSMYQLLGYADFLEMKRQLTDTAYIAKLTYKICGQGY